MTLYSVIPKGETPFKNLKISLGNFDPYLVGSVVFLLLFGLVMIASAGIDVSEQMFGVPFHFVSRHLVYLCLGLVVAIGVSSINISSWQKFSGLLLLCVFVILILVLIPGVGQEIKGSRRWIHLGIAGFQPSELAKVSLILYVASYLFRRRAEVTQTWAGFLKPIFVLSLILVLVLMEPDFGATVVMLGTVLGMLFLGGVKAGQFFIAMLVAVGSMGLMAVAEPYRLKRIMAFMDPWSDANVYSSGYQLTQSLIAFGRGEWFGVGLGNSMQKLFYLPEAHNDFIVAIIAEELGFVGIVMLLGCYALMISRIFYIGRLAECKENLFGAFMAYGIGLLFSLQAFINVSVNIGLLPTKGLTLPLISAGGTSLVVSMMLLAIVNRIYVETGQIILPKGKT